MFRTRLSSSRSGGGFSACSIYIIPFLLILLYMLSPGIEGGQKRLDEYISHYETLDYNREEVSHHHNRVKRWIEQNPSSQRLSSSTDDVDDDGPQVHINFNAHSREFRLRLKRDTSAFSDNLILEGDGVSDNNYGVADMSHLYSGYVEGISNSHAFGSIQDGVFDGKIILPDESFYVERAHKYPSSPSTKNASLHSVIYKDEDVHDPFHEQRTGHAKGCGITDEVMEWMEGIQYSAQEDMTPELSHPKSKPLHREDQQFAYSKYSREANDLTQNTSMFFNNPFLMGQSGGIGKGRGRRDTRRPATASSRTTCTLSIQTDPLLWKHISEQERTTDENKIREEILSLIAQHVKAVNNIYSNTLFDGKETYKNIRFEVQRIKIDTDRACKPDYRGEKNLFCMENIDVSNFLNLHSLLDHEFFCLAYVFTYRDFTGGTLGLAWVASASGASGGVCEKYKTYTETIGGVYQSTKRSLNTGIITFVNYNSRVPPKVSQLTLAHEIGHNFGSPHDYPNKCRPGGTDGNYIMFASATSGDRPNNSKFSECSVRNISSVLDAIIHDQKKNNCFIATNGTFCGNKIVEDGEECDCGFTVEECEEECCFPRQAEKSADAVGCRRKPGARCSPSEGPCCDQRCHFVIQNTRQMCKHLTECSYEAFCNGTSAQCPVPKPKADLTPCNDGTQVCQNGECRGSICLKYGLKECFLSSNDKSADKRKLCELACQDNSGQCRSTSELNLPGLPGGLSLRPGAPCDNFQGYCDVFLKCRAVDAEGPLARLKNLLFNKETLLNIAQWVTEYWYAVLLMGVGFIILMGLFIKCCAVHTPSSNPKKAPHIRIGDTLRRPISTLRRHRHAHSAQYRAANSSTPSGPPSGAPPPYSAIAGPGQSSSSNHNSSSGSGALPPSVASRPPAALPPHGFGEGRGPNRNREQRGGNSNRPSSGNPYAGAYHKSETRHQQHRV